MKITSHTMLLHCQEKHTRGHDEVNLEMLDSLSSDKLRE